MHPYTAFGCLLLAGCTTIGAAEPATELAYSCGDLVVVGRVRTLSSAEVPNALNSDFLPNWNSRNQLQVQIKRIIRGSEPRRAVPATQISHGQMRDDRDFLVVLKPTAGGAYHLETAALWNERPIPRLVEPCS